MNEKSVTPPSQALALERFAFITQIQDLLRQGFPLSVALEQVSYRPLILVRVQVETNNPGPGADALHAVSIRRQPWQACFQGPHHPGHV